MCSVSEEEEEDEDPSKDYRVTTYGEVPQRIPYIKTQTTKKASTARKEHPSVTNSKMRRDLSQDETFLTEMNSALDHLKSDPKFKTRIVNDNLQ